MPKPTQLILAIDRHTEIAEAALVPAMGDQGKRARRSYLNSAGLSPELIAQVAIPDAFAEELLDAAEDAVESMAEVAFGYALDTLPPSFAGATVTEVSRQSAIRGVLNGTAQHIREVNAYTRSKVRDLIIRASEQGLDNTEIAGQVERLVGDLTTKDGRLIPRRVRSRTIARTETAWASGRAEGAAWREVGVQQVEIYDGDGCGWIGHDDPDTAGGSVRSLNAYESQPLSHPNCVRTASPKG